MGSCNRTTAWEVLTTTVQRDLAAAGTVLPPLHDAIDVLRYLPTSDLQDDEVVETWLALLAEEPHPGGGVDPGRLGQLEACVGWQGDPDRTADWPAITVPVLVLAFEHDLDSPPARAAEAARQIPGARYVELAGAGHLAPMTHAPDVVAALLEFFDGR